MCRMGTGMCWLSTGMCLDGLGKHQDRLGPTVATIGNFDGVHLGHRAVFQRLLDQGRALGLPGTVITFEPQAMEYFAPGAAP